jgi:CRP-like cAMP-binding protein
MLLAAAAREEPGLPGGDGVIDSPDGEDRAMLSLVERASLLRGVPAFADLPSEHLRLLAEVAEEVEISAGETLMAAGSEGDQLYVLVSGQVALEERRGAAGSVARIATLGPGAAVGEDAVFDGGLHVLSATAVTDCRLLALRREVLLALLEEQPALARTLIAWLSARLRETSSKLAERTRARPRSVVDLLDQIGEERR